MNQQKDCIFCKIVAGDLPSYKVYEDEHTLAFLNIQPNNHGHTLVIPKDHFENIYSTPDEQLCRTMIVVRKLAIAIKNGLDTDGVNIIVNNESAAGQVIPHIHVHILPRFNEDTENNLSEKLPTQKTYKDGEAEAIAEKIKKSLE